MAGNAQSRVTRLLPRSGFNPASIPQLGLSVAAGATADVQTNNAWSQTGAQFVSVCMSGTTAQRPAPFDPDIGPTIQAGTHFLDLTLGYIVVWNGANWINPATGASV